MGIPPAILDLENRSVCDNRERTLGIALQLSVAEWRAGNRDRDLRLHLLFLCWYCNVEPPHITGFDEAIVNSEELAQLFHDVYATFADGIMNDAECLFVVGLIAQLTPWLLGEDVSVWEARSVEFRRRYRQLYPEGLPPSHFANRGAYGDYFSRQVVVPGGF